MDSLKGKYCPSKTPSNNLLNVKVSYLFNLGTNDWNRKLIALVMNAQDTSDICKIPVHSRATNVLIWKASPNGAYTQPTKCARAFQTMR